MQKPEDPEQRAITLSMLLIATLPAILPAPATAAGATQSYWPPQTTLTATNVGPTSMDLSWTSAVIVPGGYAFYHLYSDGVKARQLGQGTSAHVDGFAPLTTYHFTVELGDFSDGYIPGPSLSITTPAIPADADFTISISPNPLQIPIGRDRELTVTLTSIQDSTTLWESLLGSHRTMGRDPSRMRATRLRA